MKGARVRCCKTVGKMKGTGLVGAEEKQQIGAGDFKSTGER